LVDDHGNRGVGVVAADDGPGIPAVSLAMQDGYSTSGSLGLGLPGVRRLMDEFEVISDFGKGTTVTVRKWKRWAPGRSSGPSPSWVFPGKANPGTGAWARCRRTPRSWTSWSACTCRRSPPRSSR